jgi:7-cyano-7-deazaguanine synthase
MLVRSTVNSSAPLQTGAAALVSGGLDSAVMLAELAQKRPRVTPLYMRCGLHWEAAELAALSGFLAALRHPVVQPMQVLDFPMHDVYGSAWYASGHGIPTYHEADERWEIPGRNLVLITKAAVWCAEQGVEEVALGILAGNPFPDATPEFFHALEQALFLGLGKPIQILRPLAGLRKAEVVRRGRDLPLGLTLSCANPSGREHCGRCGKCRERRDAFREAGVLDPTAYAYEDSSAEAGRECGRD